MRITSPSTLIGALVIGLALGASSADAAAIVYSQPVTYTSAWISEDVSDGPTVWRVFDNFTLAADATIGGVSWVGAYVDLSSTGLPSPDATGFTFRFWSDDSGKPSAAPLYEESVAIASVSQQFVGNAGYGGYPARVYSFEASLTTGFAATAGTPYWLSISSIAPGGPVVFAWVAGSGGDNATLQTYVGDPIWRSSDRAFSLEAVPEPGTLILLGTGAAALVGRRRARARA